MSLFQISYEKLLDEAYDNIRWLQNNRISLQESVSYEQYEDLLDGLIESVQLFEDARDALKKYNKFENAAISSHQNNSINPYLTNYTAKKNALKAHMEKIKKLRSQGKPLYYSFSGGEYNYLKKSKWNSLPKERRELNKDLRAEAKYQGMSYKDFIKSIKRDSGTRYDPTRGMVASYNDRKNTLAINKDKFRSMEYNIDMRNPDDSDKEKLKRHMKFRHGNLAHELTHKAQFDYLAKKFGKDSPEYKRASERSSHGFSIPGTYDPDYYYKIPTEYHAFKNGGGNKSLRDRSFSKLSDQHKRDLDALATKNDKDYIDYINKHTNLFKLPGQVNDMPYVVLKQEGRIN